MPSNLSRIDQVAVAQEFHISVTPLGEDEYLVRIERVAPGVPLAEEQVRWPVEHWLAQARQLMNDPLLGLLQGGGAFTEEIFFLSEWDEPANPSTRNLVELGRELYNALFQGSLRDSWMMAQAIAQNQRQVLRLRLGLKGTRLPRLPWEVLHAGDRPLATGTDVAFSRYHYQLGPGLWNPRQTFVIRPNQPLKILMIISGPGDQETLELAQEAAHLQEELKRRSPYGLPAIELTILEQPGREQLTQALEQGQYQVFHYAGHSNLGESGGDVYLVSKKTGLTETLNGDDLAGLLANNGVQLAVFNSCRGAYTATSSPVDNNKERNLAEALVKRGIPGVLAMAERIPDAVALTLTRLLYRNINQGYPIDLSLSRARQGLISAYGSNQLYWALPVLYLHSEFNGFLTNDSPENQEKLFDLPDPPDLPLVPRPNDIVFTRSPAPSLPPEEEDELDGFFEGIPDEPEGNDDPSLFIKNLLSQLEPETPVKEESMPPHMDTQPQAIAPPVEPTSWELPANASNSMPTPTEAPATNSSAGAIEVAAPPTKVPARVSQAVEDRTPTGSRSWWQNIRRIPKLWLVLLGATSALAIALLSVWLFQSRAPQPDAIIPSPPSMTDIESSTNTAIQQLNQGNIATGQKAVEKLLDAGALPKAKAVLNAVTEPHSENPAVYFLKGRLAWQSVQAGSKDFNVYDARRYWEWARKGNPQSSAYLTALGFAYYAEGNYERANNAWFEALQLMQESQAAAQVAKNAPNQDTLTIYAGLALGLRQEAQKQPAAKRASLLSKALNMREYVTSNDSVNFQPEALSKNWLWTEKAIQDWRSLLEMK
jgi:hypothetical protein